MTTPISPNSPAAEVGIISAVIANGSEAIAACIEYNVTPASFYTPANGEVYAEVLAMHAEGKPIDIRTIAERLQTRGLLSNIGGWAGFGAITAMPPMSIALAGYCREVVSLELRRKLIVGCLALKEAATGDPDAIPEVLARLLQIQTQSSSRRSWRNVVDTAAQRAEDIIAGRKVEAEDAISFGFPDLDKVFQPMRRGELTVAAARPSHGKSSLMRQICVASAKAGRNVLVESLEVSADDIADAIASTESRVCKRDLAGAHQSDQAAFVSAVRGLDLPGLHVFDGDRSLAAIIARAKAIHAIKPLDVIAIDYLGLITDCEQIGRGENKASAVGRVTKALKALALELGCVIILLAQLNRQSVNDGNREPRLSDLRDSGDIEQDADRVIFIHRPGEDPLTQSAQKDSDEVDDRPRFFVNLIQAKGRNVGTGIASFYFHRAITRFEAICSRHAA